ncbi:BTB/POZ and TAZ domain-containing protein 1 [Lolium perenne]|uniref:BTB/POZ and TAZ domain-containing protein 1 n=1 Tax=Lolium perenne TaxID=4522 RepID=UPI0021F6110B|nr:BTB/POZ and TAZ domain-containing protein 1-like [Lolium perenne]
MTSSVDLEALRPSPADVRVVTSDGSTIAAHSSVLASASPVLERMIEVSARIRILGASPDAVAAFLRFLYSPREATAGEWGEAAMAAHGAALLALAHAHRVPWLKWRAEEAVAARLTAERAVDALKLSRLCNAPRLYLVCVRLAGKDLAAVELSEGWCFAGRHDAALQVNLLRLLHDADQRKKRWERERASQDVYRQLSDAMASLDRAFTEAYPCDDDGSGACTARQGIVQLVRHLAGCGNKGGGGGCPHCKRIFQLLRLHSSVCDRAEPCRVPLCSNLKTKMQAEKVDKTWRLLVKKVARAGVMATLDNREVPEIVKRSWAKYNSSGSRSRSARFR